MHLPANDNAHFMHVFARMRNPPFDEMAAVAVAQHKDLPPLTQGKSCRKKQIGRWRWAVGA